jgi:hypothetical protein
MKLNQEHWQILAAKVATETEPKRLAALLDALIHALDQRRKALRQADRDGVAEPGVADD